MYPAHLESCAGLPLALSIAKRGIEKAICDSNTKPDGLKQYYELIEQVSAAGDAVSPLFVFKCTHLPYRQVFRGGQVMTETYHSQIPRYAVFDTRDEHGRIDADNFYKWATLFVTHISDLTAGRRKVILTYDAYRSHMMVPVFELFSNNNVLVYALESHDSRKTHASVFVLFSSYKKMN